MDLQNSSDIQRRLRDSQRSDLLAWMITRSDEPGLSCGQVISADFLDALLKPAGAQLECWLQDPAGERLYLVLHGNGSIVIQVEFDMLSELDDILLERFVPELSQLISDLFHSDELQFSHSVVRNGEGFVLRTVSSVKPDRRLSHLAAEVLALKEALLGYLLARLQGDANG